MYRIYIGICSGGAVQAETITSLIAAMDLIKQKGVDCGLDIMIGGYVAHNRNNLVREAFKKGASHLMFIDADMIFPASGIVRLLDHDKDIVGGMYNTRGNTDDDGKLLSTIKMLDENGELPMDGGTRNFSIGPELIKVGGLGTGFLMIKMDVFKKMESPWFVAWESPEGEHHTEDIQFCVNAREAGYDIYCSPTIKIGHKGTKVY